MSMNLVACCVHKGYIFVFGFDIYMYHIESDTWHTVKSFSFPVTAFNCAMSHMNSIYLTGKLFHFDPKNHLFNHLKYLEMTRLLVLNLKNWAFQVH